MKTGPSQSLLFLGSIFFVLFVCACRESEHSSDPFSVLATIGDTTITVAAFTAELEKRLKNGQPVQSAAEKEQLLAEMIQLEILFAKAKAAGVDRDAKLLDQFKRMVVAQFEEAERQKIPLPTQPELGEIEAYYAAHRGRFAIPEKIHIAILFLKVPQKAAAEQVTKAYETALALRHQALDAAGSRADFGLLAQEHSEDQATRYRGGDCGWITRETSKFGWDRSVIDALFELDKPGEITAVIRGSEGYYIGKLIDKKPAAVAPFDAVRERIEHQLIAAKQKQAREQFLERQREGLAVSINHDLLRKIETPRSLALTGENVPSMPGH